MPYIGNSIEDRVGTSHSELQEFGLIDPNLIFPLHSEIMGWGIYAAQLGELTLSVWRLQKTNNASSSSSGKIGYTKIGENTVIVSKLGYNYFDIDVLKRIVCEKGDIIGFGFINGYNIIEYNTVTSHQLSFF